MSINDHSLEILDLLIKRQEDRVSELLSIEELAIALGLGYGEVDVQVRILDSLGAVKSSRTLDGSASPMVLDKGYLLRAQLQPEKGTDHTTDNKSEFVHSDDYRTVMWKDETFTFNKTQALCIQLLHRSFSDAVPWVSSGEIANLLSEHGIIDTRMSFIFRNHRAWKSLVIYKDRHQPFYKLTIHD